jgi:S1-C subfamily serine protease
MEPLTANAVQARAASPAQDAAGSRRPPATTMRPGTAMLRASVHAILLAAISCLACAAEDPAQQAMVKIYAVQAPPNWFQPWNSPNLTNSTGSGCFIGPRRILTNAHVVADATVVQIRRAGQARRIPAKVVYAAHDADLAVLDIAEQDAAQLGPVQPLAIGDLPAQQDEMVIYGFPMGGDTLSQTKGVTSRIEHVGYVHSGVRLLGIQVDAAINPGNSGGPAIHAGRIAGVVMQGMSSAQSIGYLVSPPVIRHVLEDLEDGTYHGFPGLDIVAADLESPAMRSRLGMGERTGIVLTRMHPDLAGGPLRLGDVLLSVGGAPIADDGTIEFRPGERTEWIHRLQLLQVGAHIPMRIWRDGAEQDLDLALGSRVETRQPLVYEQYDQRPRWFIHAGLVFVPLTRNYMKNWGREWWQQAPRSFTAMIEDPGLRERNPEPVLLSQVLAHRVNEGYHGIRNMPIEEIDGQPVRSLADALRLIETPSERPYIELRNARGGYIVLERAAAKAAHREILSTYRIPGDRSDDLAAGPDRAAWNSPGPGVACLPCAASRCCSSPSWPTPPSRRSPNAGMSATSMASRRCRCTR